MKCQDRTELTSNPKHVLDIAMKDFLRESDFSDAISLSQEIMLEIQSSSYESGNQYLKYALYELVLKFKKRNLDFDVAQQVLLHSEITNLLLMEKAFVQILEVVKPDICISYNPTYGLPGLALDLAASKGIKSYFYCGTNAVSEAFSTVRIWDWAKYGKMDPALETWEKHKTQEMNFYAKSRTIRHFKSISKGKSPWTYSAKSKGLSTHKVFDIPKSSRIVLAALSSEDEVFAAQLRGLIPLGTHSNVFTSQSNWIEELIDWVSSYPDIVLIIRLHPREFPNKRETQLAENANSWDFLNGNLPSNIRIDHPMVQFPLEDHLKVIDVFTTGWSSSALEALYHEIPVVTYDQKLPNYPADIHKTGSSKETYFSNLQGARYEGRSSTKRQDAIEGVFHSYFKGSIRLGGTLQYKGCLSNNPLSRFGWRVINRVGNTILGANIRLLESKASAPKKDRSLLADLLLNTRDNLYNLK